jgi:hypothetical protein
MILASTQRCKENTYGKEYVLVRFNHLVNFSINDVEKCDEIDFLAPKNKSDKKMPHLLSRDVLKNYTMLFSKFNGEYGVKIFPLIDIKNRADFNEIINHSIFDNSEDNSEEDNDI